MLTASLVKSIALEEGFDLAGICPAAPSQTIGAFEEWLAAGFHGAMEYLPRSRELRADPRTLMPSARSVLMLGLNYQQEPPRPEPGRPRIARYALGRDYHRVLRGMCKKICQKLSEIEAVESRICVDSAPFFEREYAQRAGLGWFGKNTCLIHSQRGSWFFLAAVLLSADLEPDAPAHGGCGTCRACIDACPTGAIVQLNGRWQVDASRCISALTIEQRGEFTAEQEAQVGDWTFGCDICQEVCPFNAARASQPLRAQPTRHPDLVRLRTWPSLVEMSTIAPEEFDELTQGSPVRRAGLEGLRRNAQANLKNERS